MNTEPTRILDEAEIAPEPNTHDASLTTHHIRNRIKGHRRVRAGDLVPHEWNFRYHLPVQRAALDAIYRDVGFARSLLAFELPDGRLKLIDGHLRRDLDPDMPVDVEILDVTEEEARKLLLTIDPLAALAHTQEEIHQRLQEITPTTEADLQAAWQAEARKLLEPEAWKPNKKMVEQFLILVTCADESEQGRLLGRFKEMGLTVKALVA
ncbi:MAG TPA: hypothetical protein VKE98_22675 [Gemmataceae bacterium]|nr:hypothetical protein [Gemmataceae bacterium]